MFVELLEAKERIWRPKDHSRSSRWSCPWSTCNTGYAGEIPHNWAW